MKRFGKLGSALLGSMLSVTACASDATPPTVPPVARVDIDRFMGDWYVIAHIPSRQERDAWGAVERYAKNADGTIGTTFRFRKGSFEAPVQTMTPKGFVRPGTNNAVWGMQFFWPIRAEYVIVDLAPDYSSTIVARSKRDYAWIMARTPRMPAAQYEAAVRKLQAIGYDTTKLRKVPQR
ncbi:outer membrane lipoprotein [Lysobacter helvus]|uniref:Outer membrane lipoprotein Blc n=2 Tax=Lysobacteraceae TaxID=32033 RepID=A0ABN6FPS9_9GAMM|nr:MULTISPECIES: lipocalin family protein [Lysobacter]BCT91627.1 outer membrane lipoprotein [Lysobacter caseinilyticus]BCT94780.1 outer membrane lipoprotein [Lysobacter helvus]